MPTIERTIKPKPPKDTSEDPLVAFWNRRLERAEKKLKEKGGDIKGGEWEKLIRFFAGDQWPEVVGKSRGKFHRITSNQVKSNVDSIRPQLYFQNPRVRIRIKNPTLAQQDIPEVTMGMGPMGPTPMPMMDPATGQPAIKIPAGAPVALIGGQIVNAQEQCDLIEAIDNYTLDETKAKLTFRRIINDALILPYGVSKWEWVVEFETAEEEQEGEDGEPTLVKTERPSRQYARVSRIKPWQFVWDADLEEFNLDLAKWYAEIKFLTEEEIREYPRIKVDFKEISKEHLYVEEEYEGSKSIPEEAKRYKVYEISDLKGEQFIVHVEGTSKLARVDSPSEYTMVEGGQYTVLGFDEVPDDSFPIPIPAQIKSKVQAYNYVLSYACNHIARFNRKYRMQEGAMDKDNKERLETGADGTIVEVKGMNLGPEPITDAQISPDVYNVGQILKREITEDIGVTAYDRGTRETGVDTAYEANLIQGGSDIKIQEKRDIVVEFVKTNIRKLNQILKKFSDKKTVTEIVGPKGSRWVAWTNEDIKGEFLEDVDVYNSLPYSREVEKKQMMELVSIASGNAEVNQRRLWLKVFRAFNLGEDLLNTPEERQQMIMQMQAQQAQEEAKRQNASTIRPSGGEVQRKTDMQAGIMGGANKVRTQ